MPHCARRAALPITRQRCCRGALQGGSFAYISPVLAVAAQIQASQTFETGHDRFLVRWAPFIHAHGHFLSRTGQKETPSA